MATHEVEVDVLPLIEERRLGVVVHGGPHERTTAAVAVQEEPLLDEGPLAIAHLVSGAAPSPDWSRLLLDAHAEGWPVVGSAVVPPGGLFERRLARSLRPWAPAGRNPRFDLPLVLPSLVGEAQPTSHLGLPAYLGDDGLFEGRAVVRLPRRSGRRPS